VTQQSAAQTDPESSSMGAPPRSGTRVLIAVAAAGLLFLAVLWYATFVALNARGPDRAFFQKESWDNGTIVLVVTELDVQGEVLLAGLTVNITSSSGANLYAGALGLTQTPSNFSLTVTWVDADHSTTLTRLDKLQITASPASGLDDLVLSTVYLYSAGREWARFPLS
jgi:hypothetical protein